MSTKPRWRIIRGMNPLGVPCFRIEKRFLWWWRLQDYSFDLYSARVRLGVLTNPPISVSRTALIEVSDDGVWTDNIGYRDP